MLVSPVHVPTLATTLQVVSLVSPMTLNLKGEMSEEMPTLATLEGAASSLEVLFRITLNLKGEEMPSRATTLEGAEMMASLLPTLASILEVVYRIALKLKGEEMLEEMQALATPEGGEMVLSPVPVRVLGTTLEAYLVSPMALNLKGEEMPVSPPVRTRATTVELAYLVSPMTLNLKGEEMVVSPAPVQTLATTVELAYLVSMTLKLKGEEMPSRVTTLEDAEMMASLLPTLASTLEVVYRIALNLSGEEMLEEIPALATPEGAEMVLSLVPVRTLATTLEVSYLVSTVTMNLKGEGMLSRAMALALEGVEMVAPPLPTLVEVVSLMALNLKIPTHATTLERSDSDPAACSTSTKSLNPTNPTNPNGAEFPSGPRPRVSAETSTSPILPPTRATSSG
jgi:hypothetical protein